jgi:hypothetical protein
VSLITLVTQEQIKDGQEQAMKTKEQAINQTTK